MTKPRLDQGAHYERGFIDGMQKQMQSSVDRAVNAMTQPTYYIPSKDHRTWVGLTEDDKVLIKHDANFNQFMTAGEYADRVQQLTEARLKDLNT